MTLWALSQALGWIYTACWSISFYPPLLLNHRLKSVEGVSFDFTCLNLAGYCFYVLSQTLLYTNPRIRKQYADRHADHMPLVRANDLVYGVHGGLLTFIMFTHFYNSKYKRRSSQTLGHLYRMILIGALSLSVSLALALTIIPGFCGLQWLDYVNLLGSLKMCMSLFKYVPQVLYNMHRQSTHGFSIAAVLLDCSGGILSVLQLLVDSIIVGEYREMFSNVVKLPLALVTLFFDSIYLIQHYVLYRSVRLAN